MSLLTRAASALLPGVIFPWSPTGNNLHALVYSDIYGASADAMAVVDRDAALRVAPIVKARAVITGRLADLPLELGTIEGGDFIADDDQPDWLTQTGDIATTPWYRMAYTLDDLLFTGWSMWAVDRDTNGAITAADRLERGDWRFSKESPTGVERRVGLVWGPITDDQSVILFAGPLPGGLLNAAHDAILGWRYMERAWVGRVRNPIPLLVLKMTERNAVTSTEAAAHVAAWSKNRMSENGAVGMLPYGVDAVALGEAKADLMNEGRNASRIDFANFTNLPVTYLDGSTATSSLTYVTQEGDRAQVIDDLEYWLTPIEAVLSETRVTGATGKVIRANRSNLTRVPNDAHGPTYANTTTPEPATQEN